MQRFSTPAQRAQSLEVIDSGAWRSFEVGTAAAWHLRQSDSRRASEVASSLLRAIPADVPADANLTSLRAFLLLVVSENLWLQGRLDEAIASCDESLVLMTAADHHAGRSDALWLSATLYGVRGDYLLRDEFMKQSLAYASSSCDAQRQASCQLALWCFAAFEDPALAMDLYASDVLRYAESPDPAIRCLANAFLGHCFVFSGQTQRALEAAFSAQREALESGQYRRAVMEASSIGALLTDLGDAEGALEHLQEALPIARSFGSPLMAAPIMVSIVLAMLSLQRFESASQMAAEAESQLSALPNSKLHLSALHALGRCEVKLGRLHEARLHFNRILQSPASGDALEMHMYASLGLAGVELAEGNASSSEVAASGALQIAQDRHDSTAEVEALLLIARARRSTLDQGGDHRLHIASDLERLLRRAVRLRADDLDAFADPTLLLELAHAVEIQGRLPEALVLMKEALLSQSSKRADQATRRGIAMEVRYKTERALLEVAHQRKIAEAESLRATELEGLNDQLRTAVSALQNAQALLMQRNEELNLAYAQISELSVTDPLTGLKNRRFLTQAIDNAVAESLRSYKPSTFAALDGLTAGSRQDLLFFLLDLDYFKRVNDVHGHAAGDAVLVQLKDRLRSVTRDQDYLIRWGGEEFLVAVRGVNRNEASLLAERLRLCVSSVPFDLPGGIRLSMTVSIGFAGFPVDPLDPESGSWHHAVELADARLYEAKRSGRNRWVGSDVVMHPVSLPAKSDHPVHPAGAQPPGPLHS